MGENLSLYRSVLRCSLTATLAFTACSGGGGGVTDASSDAVASDPCNDVTGLTQPLPTCSQEYPCTRIAMELPQVPITSQSDPIACEDERWTQRLTWSGEGVERTAC